MKFSTLSAIFKGAWLIEPSYAKSMLAILGNPVSGVTEFEESAPFALTIHSPQAAAQQLVVGDSYDLKVLELEKSIMPGATVIVPVKGAITKDDQVCGPVGSGHLAGIINQLSAIDNVKTIVVMVDSPGGMVSGTQTLAQAIKNSPKRTIAYINDGQACSAAYWIASSCNEVYASQKTDQIGSIGVYLTLADFKEYAAANNLKIHEIYSRLSSDKNKPVADALTGDYNGLQDKLDLIAGEFISAVKANRPGINLSKGDPFKGAVYFAQQATEIGLIDGIKSLDDIINENMETINTNQVTAAAASGTAANPTATNQPMVADAIKAMSAEELSALNTAIADKGLQIIASDAQLVTEEITGELNSLRAYKTETEAWLKANGAEHSEVIARNDKIVEHESKKDDLESLVAAEINEVQSKYGI